MQGKMHAARSIVGIRPYKHVKGLPVAEEFIRTFHSGVHSFEIWSSSAGRTRIVMCSSDPENELKKKITSFYPSAELYTPHFVPILADEEFCVAKAHLNSFYPLRTDVSGDPLSALLTCMTGHDAIYQVVFTPAKKYVQKVIKASRALQVGRVEGWISPRIVPAGKVEKDLSRALAEKAKSPLYFVEVRVCVIGEDSDEVIKSFSSFFELFRTAEHGFELEVVRGITKGRTMRRRAEALEEMLARRMNVPRFGKKTVLSAGELALLAHVPGEEVAAAGAGDVEWVTERKDMAPPPEDHASAEHELGQQREMQDARRAER